MPCILTMESICLAKIKKTNNLFHYSISYRSAEVIVEGEITIFLTNHKYFSAPTSKIS